VRGDRVEVVVDVGDGTKTNEIVASRAGRRVETATVRGVVEVTEVGLALVVVERRDRQSAVRGSRSPSR
jgi:hypothetical protein